MTARKAEELHLEGNDNKAVQSHMRNWMAGVQGKEQVIAPARMGQQAAIGGHLATLSFKNQKKVMWDEAAGKVHFA